MVILGYKLGYVPEFQTWLLWSYSGMYAGIKSGMYPISKPGCCGHTRVCTRVQSRVCTRVPNLVVLVILGYVPEYRTWLFGHTRACTRVDCLVILGHVPDFQTWLFWSYSGIYPSTKPGCFGHTRAGTRVPPRVHTLLNAEHTLGRVWFLLMASRFFFCLFLLCVVDPRRLL